MVRGIYRALIPWRASGHSDMPGTWGMVGPESGGSVQLKSGVWLVQTL